ncbi:unnamed protein product [Heligmosomoides polygyrus]|uniref:AsnC_trans_reg domain-containing protein n=1 Tax=Heligmosomoides polygyrus TaxID=6339 RepID=A0A183FGN2_HELPZ|nr:unnamed protein product [Heligmosomoides polygyrus]
MWIGASADACPGWAHDAAPRIASVDAIIPRIVVVIHVVADLNWMQELMDDCLKTLDGLNTTTTRSDLRTVRNRRYVTVLQMPCE